MAISFRQVESKGCAPGQAIECADAETAILRAELMARDKANIGSAAFSRRGAPTFGRYEEAVILKVFGTLPKDFDIG